MNNQPEGMPDRSVSGEETKMPENGTAVRFGLNGDGYPTEEMLEDIRNYTGRTRDFFRSLKDAWWMKFGWNEEAFDEDGEAKVRFHMSTGGWSGNEDTIGAIEDNWMLWSFSWVQTRVGGHYIFEFGPDAEVHTTINKAKYRQSASPVAQQEAATDEQKVKHVWRDEVTLLMNLRKAEAEIEMLRTMGCEANAKMPKRSQSLPPHMVHCGNCDGLGWLEIAEESSGQDIPSAPEAKGEPATQPVVAGEAELCRTCGANCIIWFTDNALWNKYGKFGILCVSCFVKKAEEMGFECTGWKLSPEGWTERLFPTTHDGDRKESE